MKTKCGYLKKSFVQYRRIQTEFEFDVWGRSCAPDLHGEVLVHCVLLVVGVAG